VSVELDYELLVALTEERVSVGDLVTLDQSTERVGEFVTGKSMDNRVSVFAMLEAARRLADPAVTVHFAATTQEEVGLRGAEALGVDLDADLVVALDTTVANDVPGFDAGKRVTELGEGVGIKLKDASVITNHKVHRRLRETAEARGVDHQFEVLPAGGTDTGGLQRASGATPAGALSVPTRYLHTPTESVHETDVEAAVELLVAFLETEGGTRDYTR
jgi:endoglucanase